MRDNINDGREDEMENVSLKFGLNICNILKMLSDVLGGEKIA